MNASGFMVKRSKFKVTVCHHAGKSLFGLVNKISCKSVELILQTFNVDAFLGKDECFSVWVQKVKDQGHSMAKWPAGGSIQSLSVFVLSLIHCVTLALKLALCDY